MNKVYPDAKSALEGVVKDGMMVMSGGFGLCGIAETLSDALRETADDFRGGPPAKTPIVPLKAEQPRAHPAAADPVVVPAPAEPPRVVIDLPKSPSDRLPLE